MANATCNVASLQICAMRVAKLDANGDALAGASNGYVAGGIIEANLGTDIENGIEILKKDGCDQVQVNYRGLDIIKRSTLDLKLTFLDWELISLLTGSQRIINGSTTIGGRIPQISDATPNGCCVEFWTKAWSVSSQSQPVVLGSINGYNHWVIPKAKFQFDGADLKNDSPDIELKGFGYENPSLNIDGPYNDWPSSVGTSGGFPSALGSFLDTSFPTITCGFTTVPAQGS